jgi:hypothetical protein
MGRKKVLHGHFNKGEKADQNFTRRLKWNRMQTNDEEVEAGCNRSAGARRLSHRGCTTQDKKFGVSRRQPDYVSSSAEAGAALAKAAKSGDETAVAEILGVDTKVLLSAGDKEADKAALEAFASKYEKMNRWVDMTDGSRVLYIGADNFAFPVPLAKMPRASGTSMRLPALRKSGRATLGATSC